MLLLHRTALRRRLVLPIAPSFAPHVRYFYPSSNAHKQTTAAASKEEAIADSQDPRLGRVLSNDFAQLRSSYQAPTHPIILAHGLLGFDELRLAGRFLPGIQYWYGIRQALAAKGVEVITAEVPPSGSIEERAQRLADVIERKAGGRQVNIIAHSMVLSLTTVASPHRGSAFADYLFARIGILNVPKLYKVLNWFGFETGAFQQLTQDYMQKSFNPRTPDREGVQYYSYGATLRPRITSVFRKSHSIIDQAEGPNDGLVSVSSSQWGTYKGTLEDVSHLDLINWTNRMRWFFWELTGHKRNFNAIAFYLDIADMLAKEGL